MAYTKKSEVISIRIPEKTKRLLEAIANRETRSLPDQILLFLKEALHRDKFNPADYE